MAGQENIFPPLSHLLPPFSPFVCDRPRVVFVFDRLRVVFVCALLRVVFVCGRLRVVVVLTSDHGRPRQRTIVLRQTVSSCMVLFPFCPGYSL